jgi:DnaK suppressor protein
MNGLDEQQWQALQARLERARSALLSQLADDLDRSTDLRLPCRMWWKPRPPTTPASALHAAVHEAATLTSQQLDIVRHALNKFGGQHYGLCERCGEVIGYSRLNARPEARLCISARRGWSSRAAKPQSSLSQGWLRILATCRCAIRRHSCSASACASACMVRGDASAISQSRSDHSAKRTAPPLETSISYIRPSS